MIPKVIQDQLAELQSQQRPDWVAEPQVGVVAIAVASGGEPGRRIVLVTGLDEVEKIAYIHLMTNFVETATDLDLIVATEESGYPVPLVAQAELYGPVFVEQLVTTYGTLDDSALEAFCSSLYSDGETLDGRRVGLPLRTEGEPRRIFKETELDALEALVEACRAWLDGAAAQVVLIDPELLMPPPPGSPRDLVEDQFLDLLDAIGEMGRLGGSMVDVVELLGGEGLLSELSRWWTEFGMDRRALKLDWLLTSNVLSPAPLVSSALPAQHKVDRVKDALVDYCADRGDPTLDLLAARTATDESLVIRQGPAGTFCRARPRKLETV